MRITLEGDDRQTLLANLGLASNTSDADLTAAVAQRLGPNVVHGRRAVRQRTEPVAPAATVEADGPTAYPKEWLPESRMTPWPRPIPGARPSRVTVES